MWWSFSFPHFAITLEICSLIHFRFRFFIALFDVVGSEHWKHVLVPSACGTRECFRHPFERLRTTISAFDKVEVKVTDTVMTHSE